MQYYMPYTSLSLSPSPPLRAYGQFTCSITNPTLHGLLPGVPRPRPGKGQGGKEGKGGKDGKGKGRAPPVRKGGGKGQGQGLREGVRQQLETRMQEPKHGECAKRCGKHGK